MSLCVFFGLVNYINMRCHWRVWDSDLRLFSLCRCLYCGCLLDSKKTRGFIFARLKYVGCVSSKISSTCLVNFGQVGKYTGGLERQEHTWLYQLYVTQEWVHSGVGNWRTYRMSSEIAGFFNKHIYGYVSRVCYVVLFHMFGIRSRLSHFTYIIRCRWLFRRVSVILKWCQKFWLKDEASLRFFWRGMDQF